VSFFGLFLLIFIIEAFFGIVYWYKEINKPEERMGVAGTEFDSALGWATIKNAQYIYGGNKITINSLGFRSPEVDFSKEHILVLGDFVTFGYWISDDETISYFLSDRLKNKYKNIQVLNLGVTGYGVDQYYLNLKRHIETLNPKIIVILICSRNDLTETSSESPYGRKKPFFILENGELRQVVKKISFLNCENIFSKSWLLQKPFFSSYRKTVCRPKFHSIKQTT
jgi:hypothetical protein